ncbi:MAG TPA: TrbC/VirB2 family protein [Candidatus Paceibacterota bacterium]
MNELTRRMQIVRATAAQLLKPRFTMPLLIAVSALPSLVVAAETGLHNPLKVSTVQDFLTTILGYVVQVGTVVIVLMIVVVGFRYVTARGNPGELEKAHKALLWTLIGALVLLGAQAIASAVSSTVTAISSS